MASSNVNNAVAAANLDAAVGFSLPARSARGRLVRLGPLLDDVLSAHDYPAPIARILSEALVLTALLGATLKGAGGQLTLQAQTEAGIIDLLVCDYKGGEIRGYVRYDAQRLAAESRKPHRAANRRKANQEEHNGRSERHYLNRCNWCALSRAGM